MHLFRPDRSDKSDLPTSTRSWHNITPKLFMAYPPHLGGGLPFLHTHNEIRPDDERFRSIYVFGFETWPDLYSASSTKRKLPPNYLLPQEALPHHPSLPATGSAEYYQCEAFITSSSLWGSKVSSCKHELLSFERPVQIGVTTKNPIPLSVSDIAQDNINCSSWFVSDDDDYLAILILAWAYILSARWAELMPTTCPVEYTHAFEAQCDTLNETKSGYSDSNTVYIDIDYADQDEARWWSAIFIVGPRLAGNNACSKSYLSIALVDRFSIKSPVPFIASFTTECFALQSNITNGL